MAIFSLSIQSVGRSSHAEGTAGAHAMYIGRNGACPSIGAYGIPENAKKAQSYLNEQELKDRKNSRVIDKLIIAMPRELSPEQRYALAHEYGREVTAGRAMYFFAMHETGEDAHNPHCHMIIRDRDIETGAYVMKFSDSPRDWKKRGMSGNSPTEYLRERWEYKANEALEKAGHSVRIDRRSLVAQRDEALQRGDMLRAQELDRKAQIHVGVRAQQLAEKGIKPRSQGNYTHIDNGTTRPEHNANIINMNLEKRLRSRDVSTRTRALFEKEQARLEQDLKQRHDKAREGQERKETETRAHHKKILQGLGKDRNAYAEKQQEKSRSEGKKARLTLEKSQSQEREKQRLEQGRFFARLKRLIDITGKASQKDKQAIQELSKQQQGALKALEQKHSREAETVRQQALEAHSHKINHALAERDKALQNLEQHKDRLEQQVQAEFQKRAIDRYHGKEALEVHIKEQEKKAKAQERERAKAQETTKETEKQKDTGTQRQKQPVKSLKQKREEERTRRPHIKPLRQNLDAQKEREQQRQDRLNTIRQTGRERMQERQHQQKPQQPPEHKKQEVQAVMQHFRAVNEQDNTRQQAQEWHNRQHQERQAQAEGIQQKSQQQEHQRQQVETQYHAPQHTPSTPMQKDFARQQRAQDIAQELQQARETPQPNRQREIEI